jgi:hypothetical protein
MSITYANVKFGTHVSCQVATGLKDKFKVFITTNNTHHFLFQFYVFLDRSKEREREREIEREREREREREK